MHRALILPPRHSSEQALGSYSGHLQERGKQFATGNLVCRLKGVILKGRGADKHGGRTEGMKPSGHFATAVGAAGVTYAGTGSAELAVGVFTGGFLIDLDHFADYVLFERQVNLNPFRFLNYYHTAQFSWVVLGLHSYELMTCLTLLAAFTGWQWLIGYLLGAAMHLGFDIAVNGEVALLNPIRFYSFFYRLRYGFAKQGLIREFPSPLPESARENVSGRSSRSVVQAEERGSARPVARPAEAED
jgi:hypothetical protein